jgi:hypothetical protein
VQIAQSESVNQCSRDQVDIAFPAIGLHVVKPLPLGTQSYCICDPEVGTNSDMQTGLAVISGVVDALSAE